jgi:hypothetical protein
MGSGRDGSEHPPGGEGGWGVWIGQTADWLDATLPLLAMDSPESADLACFGLEKGLKPPKTRAKTGAKRGISRAISE